MRWSLLGPAARVVKALANASVFYWLALPLVVLSTCGGSIGQVTGYQALEHGLTISGLPFGLPGDVASFGPDWWVIAVMVFATAGIASALRGGVIGSAAGLGCAIAGWISINGAVSFYNPAPSLHVGWSPMNGDGGDAIELVFFGVGLIELGYMSGRSWYEVRHSKDSPNRGDWYALGCFTTAFLILIALPVLLLLLFTQVFPGHG